MMNQLIKDLLAVEVLLSDETKWCKGSLARNKWGRPVLPGSRSATCWCLVGAVERILKHTTPRKYAVAGIDGRQNQTRRDAWKNSFWGNGFQ
jgi:hypothetical protein